MTELDQLQRVRAGVAPMSEHARNHARLRLAAAMAGDGPTLLRRPVARRRLAVGLAFGLALTGAATGALVLGTPEGQTPASAADVFNRAAETLEAHPGRVPRPDQYIFKEIRRRSTTTGPDYHMWVWEAADGTRPGWMRTTDESSTCDPTASPEPRVTKSEWVLPPAFATPAPILDNGARRVDGCTEESPIDVYDPAAGLANAPYTVLAKLPTEPDALMAVLRGDPASHVSSPAPGVGGPVVTHDNDMWNLIRDLGPRLPSAQRAALFRAAARLQGVRVHPRVTDVEGLAGIGLGMDDPRLGPVVLVFDPKSFRYLGEVIYGHDGGVVFSGAELRTAIVDRVGQLPK